MPFNDCKQSLDNLAHIYFFEAAKYLCYIRTKTTSR